jgi:hypothetical protein
MRRVFSVSTNRICMLRNLPSPPARRILTPVVVLNLAGCSHSLLFPLQVEIWTSGRGSRRLPAASGLFGFESLRKQVLKSLSGSFIPDVVEDGPRAGEGSKAPPATSEAGEYLCRGWLRPAAATPNQHCRWLICQWWHPVTGIRIAAAAGAHRAGDGASCDCGHEPDLAAVHQSEAAIEQRSVRGFRTRFPVVAGLAAGLSSNDPGRWDHWEPFSALL